MHLIHAAATYFRSLIQRFSNQDHQVAVKSDDVGFRMLVFKKPSKPTYICT